MSIMAIGFDVELSFFFRFSTKPIVFIDLLRFFLSLCVYLFRNSSSQLVLLFVFLFSSLILISSVVFALSLVSLWISFVVCVYILAFFSLPHSSPRTSQLFPIPSQGGMRMIKNMLRIGSQARI